MAEHGRWKLYVPEGARSIKGKPTGFAYRNASVKTEWLMIYLEAGGACFDAGSCDVFGWSGSVPPFDAKRFFQTVGLDEGLFGKGDDNRLYTHTDVAFVGYASGDTHAGERGQTELGHFSGRNNLRRYLRQIQRLYEANLDPSRGHARRRVFFGGTSGGGTGAFLNTELVRQHFPAAEADLVVFSFGGVVLDDDYLSPTIQAKWVELWSLGNALEGVCDACIREKRGLSRFIPALARKHPSTEFRIALASHDAVMSFFNTRAPEMPNFAGFLRHMAGYGFNHLGRHQPEPSSTKVSHGNWVAMLHTKTMAGQRFAKGLRELLQGMESLKNVSWMVRHGTRHLNYTDTIPLFPGLYIGADDYSVKTEGGEVVGVRDWLLDPSARRLVDASLADGWPKDR